MAVLKFSQITAGGTIVAADTFVGVHGGNTDQQWTGTQLQTFVWATPTFTGVATASSTLVVTGAATVGGGITASAAGGSGPSITSVDSRGGGGTVSMAANFTGLGGPGVFSVGAFPLGFGTNTTQYMSIAVGGVISMTGTTASIDRTSGVLVIGNGTAGGLAVGGQGSFGNLATFAAVTTAALDCSNQTVTIANGASSAITTNAGIVIVTDCTVAGQTGAYVLGGATTVFLGGGTDWVASTTTPAANKMSVAYDGVSAIKIYNNRGSTVIFSVGSLKTRTGI